MAQVNTKQSGETSSLWSDPTPTPVRSAVEEHPTHCNEAIQLCRRWRIQGVGRSHPREDKGSSRMTRTTRRPCFWGQSPLEYTVGGEQGLSLPLTQKWWLKAWTSESGGYMSKSQQSQSLAMYPLSSYHTVLILCSLPWKTEVTISTSTSSFMA